jgi:RNA polymerase sigma-70 factor (ECF subfamily)
MASSNDGAQDGGPFVDADLAKRAAQGDRAAFHLIMRRNNRALFRTARSILKDDNDAQDAVQEAYLRAFQAMDAFRGEAALRTWLVRIVANQALELLRRNKRRAEVHHVDGQTADGDAMKRDNAEAGAELPEDAALRAQMRRLLEAAVDALPDDFRAAFVLRAVEGFSVEETASALDIPQATVRTRYFRAKQLLRDMLSREGGFDFADVFPFAGPLCDRMVARVMARL